MFQYLFNRDSYASIVLCVFLLYFLSATTVGKRVSPEQTLTTFCTAVESGDASDVLRCFTTVDDKRAILLRAGIRGMIAHYRLRQDLKRFGEAANHMTTPSLIDEIRDRLAHSKLQVKDGTAVFDTTYEPKVIAVHPPASVLRLRKVQDQWLIDARDLSGTDMDEANISSNLKKVEMLTQILREVADDIENGKVSTLKEANEELFKKLIAGPSTRPEQ
jgi:hypothetical protein